MLNIYGIKQIKKLRTLARVRSYMTLKKRKLSWTHFLMHSLTTASLLRYFTVVKIVIKSNIYMTMFTTNL